MVDGCMIQTHETCNSRPVIKPARVGEQYGPRT